VTHLVLEQDDLLHDEELGVVMFDRDRFGWRTVFDWESGRRPVRLLARARDASRLNCVGLADNVTGPLLAEGIGLWLQSNVGLVRGPAIRLFRDCRQQAVLAEWVRIRDRVPEEIVGTVEGLPPPVAEPALAASRRPDLVTTAARASSRSARGPRWPRLPATERTVAFVGDFPWRADELKAQALGVEVRSLDTPDFVDTIVVGWDCDEPDVLVDWIEQPGRPPRFLPQEGWIALLLLEQDWWLDEPASLNRVADEGHPIKVVREAWPSGFRWPGVEVEEIPEPTGQGLATDPAEESHLHRLGYQITGMGRADRWRVLTVRAVPELGLQETANTIAGHVRLRRRMRGGESRFAYAIQEWEHDLERLRSTYFRPGATGFPWPSTDR
jgi:hypothetical protein